MQIICTSFQTDNHTSTSPLSFYRLDALPATQPTVSKHWRQSWVLTNKLVNSASARISRLMGPVEFFHIPAKQKSAKHTNSTSSGTYKRRQLTKKRSAIKTVLILDQSESSLSFSEGWTGDPIELDALCETWLSGDDVVTVSWLDWLSVDARDFDTEGDVFSL